MDIALAPHYRQLLGECVESGRYNDARKIMGKALWLWEQQKSAVTWLKNEAMTGYKDVLAATSPDLSHLALACLRSLVRDRSGFPLSGFP